MTPATETAYAVGNLLSERRDADTFAVAIAITRAAAELLARTDGADASKVRRAAGILAEMLARDATKLTHFNAEYHERKMRLAVAWAETECGIDETNEAIERALA